jgi:hypothetical protein
MTGRKQKYRASKIKSFLFFLLLALVFWILTKFSEESTAFVNSNLVFTNLPDSVSISPETRNEVAFTISANGFQLLSYKLKAPTIDIDISRYYEAGDTLVLISDSELTKIISKQIDNNNGVRNLSVDQLKVYLDVMVTKKVPVNLISDITFKDGYKLVGVIKLNPDSVIVSGPSTALRKMGSISSETFVQRDISESTATSVGLLIPSNSAITLSESEVGLQMEVAEFSQKRLTLPVEVINVPADVTLKLIPESIVISFDVSVNGFNNISERDFRIVCDYATKSSEEPIMVPKLIQQPEGLGHIEWSTKRIEYLIFK